MFFLCIPPYVFLFAASIILLCNAFVIRRKGHLTTLERVGIVSGIVVGAIGIITFFLGNDIIIPFLWRGIITVAGIFVILLSIFIPRHSHASPEKGRLTASTTPQEQGPSLVYGKIVVRHITTNQHGGTYYDSIYLLEVINSMPSTVATNCEATFDLRNNTKIYNLIGLWNKNDSPRISIGHSELLKLFSVLVFKSLEPDDTTLRFFRLDIDGVLDTFEIPYIENLNRELRVLIQSVDASYPLLRMYLAERYNIL